MNCPPTFIVGFGRSGTTLLASLLDRHSEIAVTPETHFFDLYLKNARDSALDKETLVERLLAQPRILDLGVGREAILEAFEEFDGDNRGLFLAMLEAYRRLRAKRCVIEKTPMHRAHVSTIMKWFPDARVIHIERDGRDAVMSYMRMPWSHRNLRRHAREWRWSVGRARVDEAGYGANWLTVRYEALVRQPERELDRVCSFLGVSREERQLDTSIATGAVPEWEREWKSNAEESVNTGAVQSWRGTCTKDQLLIMNTMMGAALRDRDYPDVNVPAVSIVKRFNNAIANAVYLAVYHPAVQPRLAQLMRFFRKADGGGTITSGEDACAEWHEAHGTRERIGA